MFQWGQLSQVPVYVHYMRMREAKVVDSAQKWSRL